MDHERRGRGMLGTAGGADGAVRRCARTGRRDQFVHASRRAPRCLPCNYTDPLESTGVGEAINMFHAVKACPCTLDALCKGAENTQIINAWDCRFTKWRPAWWYFAHGGAPTMSPDHTPASPSGCCASRCFSSSF